ncbi:polysialyltransferase family glycosyltransferase [Thiomicrorhabdus indica]|uniref:polysialyltransferase family glycosyltransferase n=1 Tax=Thiomicrorhabdus indica TaxID=2267253 RepID=UPI002AA87D62|nr:hypothetical protein [Thiomicrorhabdus indica]
MKTVSLYISATPWNFLNSFAFAANRAEETSYLMYVDFPEGEDNIYLQALDKMEKDSPFVKAWCFHGKYKGAWKKWRNRLQEIQQIKQIVAELEPDQVFVGSDRRIEFQCAMTEAVKHKPDVKGIYLDEGLFSYTCRKRSQTWRDRVLDSWLKRLMYPVDWKHPSTIGASDWISEGWVLKPEEVCKILRARIVLKLLPRRYYWSPALEGLKKNLLTATELTQLEQGFDDLVILPHPSQFTVDLQNKVQHTIRTLHRTGRVIRVKRHPRDETKTQFQELPKHIPLELLLPFLDFKTLISAPSTAALTSQLLKPDVKVVPL